MVLIFRILSSVFVKQNVKYLCPQALLRPLSHTASQTLGPVQVLSIGPLPAIGIGKFLSFSLEKCACACTDTHNLHLISGSSYTWAEWSERLERPVWEKVSMLTLT